MKKFFKSLSLPALALVIYIVVQSIVLSVVAVIAKITGSPMSIGAMSAVLIISSVITAFILMTVKKFGLRQSFSSIGCSPQMLVLSITAAILGMFATDLANEQLNLKNILEEQFIGMSSNIYGILAISLVGPVMEEILFRGAIMSPMLRKGIHPWLVIVFSALVFGIIHANPAQIPFAFIAGVILAIIYYKTGSLVGSSICHVINNSMSVYLMNRYGEELKDIKWENILGGTTVAYTMMAVCAALSVWLLVIFWKKQDGNRFLVEENQQ